LPTSAQAQDWTVGLKGGVSQGTFLGDDVSDAEYRAGFSGGAYLEYRVTPAFSLQPEVLFSMKGADVLSGEPVLDPGDHEVHYLDIPVLLKLNAPFQGAIQPALYAGPQLGFNLYGERNEVELDDDNLQSDEFSAVLGGDIGFDLRSLLNAPVRIVLDGRYVFGLTNTFDLASDPSIRNGTFVGSAGVEFTL
jgi:hypothetical protein